VSAARPVAPQRVAAGVADTAQLIALRAASPLRADRGRAIERQYDTSDCPLFAATGQGRLL
jgi:hypothetical protein